MRYRVLPDRHAFRVIGDRPNAVHLMIIGAQQYLLFMSSFPFLGKYCFVRRLTTRGLDRPLGLV